MQFETREYTAQVLKCVGQHKWQVVKNTTFTVVDHRPPSAFQQDMMHFRMGLRYGGYVTPPAKSFRWLTGI